ncbi:MAG: hypothetical protein KF746_06875 [Chitinophagaceae bacterium]|nr:hypothetical protein [Chitinophagaceae bacterium]
MMNKKIFLAFLAFVAVSGLGSCGCHKNHDAIVKQFTPGAVKFGIIR